MGFGSSLPLFCMSLVLVVDGVYRGATPGDSKRLLQYLRNNSDLEIRPVRDQSRAIRVQFQAYLVSIQRFDELAQTLVSDLNIHFTWTHETGQWDPGNFSGIEVAFLPPHDLWLPDIAMFNVNDDINERIKRGSTKAVLYPDGANAWAIHLHALGTLCPIDITKYPFDTQVCNIIMGPDYLPPEKQEMVPVLDGDPVSTEKYIDNNEWELLDCSLVKNVIPATGNKTMHMVRLTLRRRSLFYVLTIIMPLLTLAVMNIVAFKLPASSGEKAGYCMAMFLTFVVLLNTLRDSMPRISKTTSYLQVYIILQLIASMIITTLSVGLVSIINKQGEDHMPGFLAYLIKLSRRTQRPRRVSSVGGALVRQLTKVSDAGGRPDKNSVDKTSVRQLTQISDADGRPDKNSVDKTRVRQLSMVSDFVGRPDKKLTDDETVIDDDITKLEATDFVDRWLFYIFLVFSIVSTVALLMLLLL